MIRTIDQLLDKVSGDIIWRRKELTELKAMVQEHRSEVIRSHVLIRCSVALLYAHWEGFVKKSASYYLEYVSSHRLEYKNLAANFVGLTLKAKFTELNASKKISGGNSLANFFCSELDKKSNVPYRNVVDTKSNLGSEALTDILHSLGFETSLFSTRMKFIDANLVNPRNHIAHGAEADVISVEEYITLHEDVLSLINLFKDELENAAVQKKFKRK